MQRSLPVYRAVIIPSAAAKVMAVLTTPPTVISRKIQANQLNLYQQNHRTFTNKDEVNVGIHPSDALL